MNVAEKFMGNEMEEGKRKQPRRQPKGKERVQRNRVVTPRHPRCGAGAGDPERHHRLPAGSYPEAGGAHLENKFEKTTRFSAWARSGDQRRGDAELDPYVTPPVYASTP
jgi:hypothetical protein